MPGSGGPGAQQFDAVRRCSQRCCEGRTVPRQGRQQYAGASQAKIGAAVDLTQARANEVINGRREVSRLNVYERTANGLGMPDDARHLLGPAASRDVRHGGQAMKIRGKVAAVALVLGAAVAGAVLLWPTGKDTPAAPTHEQISEQIKASAGARLDASLQEGRTARQVIVDKGYAPSNELCQAVWDRKTAGEQHALANAMWMHGCADAPTQ
jgi:hypothetical protein